MGLYPSMRSFPAPPTHIAPSHQDLKFLCMSCTFLCTLAPSNVDAIFLSSSSSSWTFNTFLLFSYPLPEKKKTSTSSILNFLRRRSFNPTVQAPTFNQDFTFLEQSQWALPRPLLPRAPVPSPNPAKLSPLSTLAG